jgi:hypothetical protein
MTGVRTPAPCIYNAISLPTELSSRDNKILILILKNKILVFHFIKKNKIKESVSFETRQIIGIFP